MQMPMRIGLILYPLVPLILVGSQRGPISVFYRAGAISPETARRPQSVKAKGELDRSIKRGLLVPTGDGRYYVNVDAYRRRVRLSWAIGIALTLLFAAAAVVLFWPTAR
jgi:hypothetical protein